MTALSGKTIAVPDGPLQDYNSRALDMILSYYNIAPESVKREFLPIAEIGPAIHHPEVAAYLTNGDQSFFDQLQQYFYVVGIPLSVAASLAALVTGHWRSRKLQSEQRQILRLLVIANEAVKADLFGLEKLEVEFRVIVASCVNKLVEGKGPAEQLPVSLVIDHARVRSRRGKRCGVLATFRKLPSPPPPCNANRFCYT